MNTQNGSTETASEAVVRNAGDFVDNLILLSELQVKLLAADLEEIRRGSLVPSFLLLLGVGLGLACYPIALVGAALLIVQIFEISYAAGFLIVAGLASVLSGILCVIGGLLLRKRMSVLRRSREELVRNMRWIQTVLTRKRIHEGNGINKSVSM